MKKIISVLMAILAVSALLVSLSAVSFNDVPTDAYYADAAERMAEKGILSGFGDGRYYGDWELTRAQFAALACKLLGKVDEATALAGKTSFADVPETHWSTGYVNYAVANKIINGDGDGNFRPDDSVKYEEAIKVIVCVLEPNKTIAIDPTDWSKNFISEANALGITNNLMGQKGEFMKRSDIAVIADAAFSILETKAEETSVATTTKKQGGGGSSAPSAIVTTAATTENVAEPEETVEVTTTVTTEAVTTEEVTTEFSLPSFVDDGNSLPFIEEE